MDLTPADCQIAHQRTHLLAPVRLSGTPRPSSSKPRMPPAPICRRTPKAEFGASLECDILADGVLADSFLRCGDCDHDEPAAFSCKRRGFFDNGGARRMVETATRRTGFVIPHVRVGRWVLIQAMRLPMPMPMPLRLLVAAQPKLVTADRWSLA